MSVIDSELYLIVCLHSHVLENLSICWFGMFLWSSSASFSFSWLMCRFDIRPLISVSVHPWFCSLDNLFSLSFVLFSCTISYFFFENWKPVFIKKKLLHVLTGYGLCFTDYYYNKYRSVGEVRKLLDADLFYHIWISNIYDWPPPSPSSKRKKMSWV